MKRTWLLVVCAAVLCVTAGVSLADGQAAAAAALAAPAAAADEGICPACGLPWGECGSADGQVVAATDDKGDDPPATAKKKVPDDGGVRIIIGGDEVKAGGDGGKVLILRQDGEQKGPEKAGKRPADKDQVRIIMPGGQVKEGGREGSREGRGNVFILREREDGEGREAGERGGERGERGERGGERGELRFAFPFQTAEGGEKKFAFLGIQPAPVGPVVAAQLGLEDGRGVVVTEVVPDSPAAKAGLKPNDVLTMIDDQVIYSVEQLKKLVAAHKPGAEARLTFIHKAKQQSAEVKLGGTAQRSWGRPEGMEGMGPMMERLHQMLRQPQFGQGRPGPGQGPAERGMQGRPGQGPAEREMQGRLGREGPQGAEIRERMEQMREQMGERMREQMGERMREQPGGPMLGPRGPQGPGERERREGQEREQLKAAQAGEYFCPMHPNVVRPEPGTCPMCGMPLSKRPKMMERRPMPGAAAPAPGGPMFNRPGEPARPGPKAPQLAPRLWSGAEVLKVLASMREDIPPRVWERLEATFGRWGEARQPGSEVLDALAPVKGDLPEKVWVRMRELFSPRPNPGPMPGAPNPMMERRGAPPMPRTGESPNPGQPNPGQPNPAQQRQFQLQIGPGGLQSASVTEVSSANYRLRVERRSGQPAKVTLFNKDGKAILKEVTPEEARKAAPTLDEEARDLLLRPPVNVWVEQQKE